jgi:hypothetical protein
MVRHPSEVGATQKRYSETIIEDLPLYVTIESNYGSLCDTLDPKLKRKSKTAMIQLESNMERKKGVKKQIRWRKSVSKSIVGLPI